MVQYNYDNIIDKNTIFPKTYPIEIIRDPCEFQDVEPSLLENMGMDQLSEKAKAIISSIGKMVVFANELHSYGDCDNEGPLEIFNTLFLIAQEEDMTFTRFKFFREIYYIHGESEDSVDYQPDEPNYKDHHMFDAIMNDMHSNDYETEFDDWKEPVHNIKPSNLSKPGKAVFDKIQEGLTETDKVFFIGENETNGKYDREGPLEEFYTLYIFVIKADGSIVHHKFYREFFWRHDKEKDAVPYEESSMSRDDFLSKQFHL
jgi:hypothetical protein